MLRAETSKAGCWMARANENASAHGRRELKRRFMVFKRAEASSPDWPPDKKAIPGTAAGTVRHRLFTVMLAASSTDACVGQVNPGSTMLGFKIMPSSTTRWEFSWIFKATSSSRSMKCSRERRDISVRRNDARTGQEETETHQVRVPKRVQAGQSIRVSGEGGEGSNAGSAGDIYLRVC